ncbi:MAG: radical SAM protein [Prevotellaceae bacterium]|jgi:organic radical activating enzyme|nr:radical SAM protein [Prevotellaceae bacterium]
MIFNNEQILELLKSDNLHFRKIAAKTIVDEFDNYSDLFFTIILDSIDCGELSEFARQRFPSLRNGFESAIFFNSSKKYLYFANQAREHCLFLEKLQQFFERDCCLDRQKCLIHNLLKIFGGLKNDISYLFPQYKELCKEPIVLDNRQLMVFITGKCNLNCSYCFSNEMQQTEMPLLDFEEILQWAKNNQITQISLCGGEPTSHSQFDKILELIQKNGLKTYFASNFTIDCTMLKNFNANIIDKIFIHLTKQIFKIQQLKNQLLKNIEFAKKNNIELLFRTNIYDTNPTIETWFELMQKTDIKALNIALTFPAKNKNNEFVNISNFEQYYSVLENIINQSVEKNIDLSFAKPIPLCVFDEKTSQYLLSAQNFYPLCNANEQNCTRNLCINPQKEFHVCLGITDVSLKFQKNITWLEIENFCKKTILPLLTKPLFAKCADCFLFDRKLCQGVCLSYKSDL